MNREILFKGKRKNWKELPKEEWWVEGYYFCMVHNDGSHVHHFIIPLGVDLSFGTPIEKIQVEVDSETVCQYAGLTERNGRKVFEEDIVRAIYKPKDDDLTTDDFIIKWDKYYCRYVGYYARKKNVYNPLLFGSQTSFEVIGNIFDNPELLGTGNTSGQQDG